MNTLLAAVSEPAPAGQSSSLGIAIILAGLAAGIVVALLAAFRRPRGEDEPKPPPEDGKSA